MPHQAADTPMHGVDTAELFAALEGESNNTRSLERVCRHLKIETSYLHNAGNDAYVSACPRRKASTN